MSNYTAPAAPTATPAAPPSDQPPSQQAQSGGGPYLPHQAVLGGLPTIDLDVPVCAVFLLLFIAGATFNMAIFQINRKQGYKFLFSGLLFGFCMARIVAMSTRIAWAVHPHNIKIAIASQIFTAAGVILLFVTNLIFAQRIIRAYHPFFGWSKPVSILFKVLYVSIVAVLILVITVTVHSFFTLDPTARQTDRIIQLFSGTYLASISFLPIPLALTAVIIPRRTRIDKFGQGHFSTKFSLLLFTAALLATGAIFRAVTNFYVRPVQNPAWFQSKACYYCFNFGIEVLVVYIYALSRFDKRFHVPDGSSAPGHYSCSEDGMSPARSARTSAASLAANGNGGYGRDRERGRHSYHHHDRHHHTRGNGYRGYRDWRGDNMVSLSDLDKLKQPASAHVRSSKRMSAWSNHSRKTVRSSGVPLTGTTTKNSCPAGVGAGYGYVNGGERDRDRDRAKSVRSAPRSVRSFYLSSGPDGDAARSEADIATLEADMEWMARAMRELYGDEEVAESSSHERRSHGHHRDRA